MFFIGQEADKCEVYLIGLLGTSSCFAGKTLRLYPHSPNEVPDGASPEVSERRRRLAATGKWPLRRPMRSDKQGYGASSEVLTS